MKRILQKARIKHLTEKRNSYLIIAMGSVAANILLAIYINTVSNSEKTHFIPPVVDKPFWVSAKEVSPEYLSGMSIFLTDLLLNVTPSNASMKHQLFLRYVDSPHYDKFKTELISQEDRLKKDHTTISFQLTDPQVDASQLTARITGDVQYRVGEAILPVKHLIYEMKFIYKLGLLQVISFEEINPHV
jgi:type IV conjugative transfer system protein TraE